MENISERNAGFDAVKKALDEFDDAWENLKTVYAETRYISYPNNYIPDRYFHFASQREDLSWMIKEEEQIRPIINDWLNEVK